MIDDYEQDDKGVSVHLQGYKDNFSTLMNMRKFETQYDVQSITFSNSGNKAIIVLNETINEHIHVNQYDLQHLQDYNEVSIISIKGEYIKADEIT